MSERRFGHGLFRLGEFTLHSGEASHFKIDCADLGHRELTALARMALDLLPCTFGGVAGVPRGGLRMADAMRVYSTSGPLLIVDDVLTSGGSMEKAKSEWGNADSIGLVIFARGHAPDWITPIFTMGRPCESIS